MEDIVFTFSIVILILSFVIGFLVGLVRDKSRKKTSEKLDDLSKVVERASIELMEVEKEVEEKRKKLEELEGMKERYELLTKMKQDEIGAIKMEIADAIRKNERREFIKDVGINTTFYILGIITILILKL